MSLRHALIAAALTVGLSGAPAMAQNADDAVQAGIAAYSRDNNRTAARSAFLKAIELDPRNAAARFNLAMMAENEERWDEAIGYYEEYLSLVPAEDLYRDVAQRKVAGLRTFAELDRTAQGKSERIFLQMIQRAQAKLAGGDFGAALALSEIAVQSSADRFEGHLLKGAILVDLERYKEGQTSLIKAKELAPAAQQVDLDALITRARKLMLAQGKIEAADAAFEAKSYAVAADAYGQAWTLADQPEFGIQAARAWSLAGEPERALKIYDILAGASEPGIANVARQERGQVSLLAVAAEAGDPSMRPEYARAREAIGLGKFYEADAQLSQMLEGLMPDRGYAPLYEARGAARVGLKEYIGAIADFTMASLLEGSRAAIFERRAGAYAALGRFSEAASDIGLAMERSPASDQARLRGIRQSYADKAKP